HQDVDVLAGALAKGRELVADVGEHVAVGIQLGAVAAAAGEARRVLVGLVDVEDHRIGLERRPALLAHLLAEVHHVLQRLEPWDLHGLPARDPVGAAVRPVDAHALAHGPAEQLVDRYAERARLDVEQRGLDGRDRLLHDAARGLAPHGVEQGDDGLPGPRVLADDQWDQAVDDGGDAEAAEGLVVLAPAHEAVVRDDLEEVEVAIAGVGVQVLDSFDLHAGLLAGCWRTPASLTSVPQPGPVGRIRWRSVMGGGPGYRSTRMSTSRPTPSRNAASSSRSAPMMRRSALSEGTSGLGRAKPGMCGRGAPSSNRKMLALRAVKPFATTSLPWATTSARERIG